MAVALIGLARAQDTTVDSSAWDNDTQSAMRLIAGGRSKNAGMPALRAGIEIKLPAGWKTYWRYPGDSGIPPRFDFAGSENVKHVTVLWPAPNRFGEEGSTSIGYKGGVLFPLRVEPQDPKKPVALHLKLDYAICEKLCVPAHGKAVLALSGRPGPHDTLLANAEAAVPKPAAIGDSGALAVRAVHREAASPYPRILVDLAVPPGRDVDLFAEGPTADWALPLPKPTGGAPEGLRRFSFELDGLPPGAKASGAVLKLTAIAAGEAIEVAVPLN